MPASPGPDQYVFITPVWGEAFVERFVKVSLPTQLSPGNLGAIPAARGRYLIYTRREDVGAIRRSAAYRHLKTIMPVAICSLDDLPTPGVSAAPHTIQTAAYARGIAAGQGKNAAFVFLTPDLMLGEGSLANADRLLTTGHRAILVAGIRMTTSGAVACVATHRTTGQPAAPVSSRALVRALLANPHPLTSAHVMTAHGVRAFQHLYWKVGDHGLLARGFHLHPLVVWPRNPGASITATVDDDYVARACPDPADWYTVTDSDEVCVLEFSDPHHNAALIAPRPLGDDALVAFLHASTNPAHRELVGHRLRFHTGEVEPAQWEPAGRESDRFVARCRELHATTPPPCGNSPDRQTAANAVGRVQRLLDRPDGETWSLFKLFVVLAGLPVWLLYRVLSQRVHHQIDRLTAECLELRTRLDEALQEHRELAARVYQARVRFRSRDRARPRRTTAGSHTTA